MYITPDLFGSPNRLHATASTTLHARDSMVDAQYAPGLGKRKRQFGAEEDSSYEYGELRASKTWANLPAVCSNSMATFQQASPTSNRGARKLACPGHVANNTSSNHAYRASPPPYTDISSRPRKQFKRMSPKIALRKLPSHLMDVEVNSPPNASNPTPNAPPTTAGSDLRACHVCHSAPKRKSELENYLECQSCSERACYICARKCSGGCRKQMCSKCCVEVGEEGDTYCLECYQQNVNAA